MKPNSFVKFFITWLDKFHKTQVKTLAVLIFALMCTKRLGVASLGRALPTRTAEKHRIKRVDRFLGNRRIPTQELAKALAQAIVSTRKLVLVAVDWTDLHDGKHQALVAGIIIKGRALPVFWTVVPKTKLSLSQNRIEENFVLCLKKILPRDCEVVILADRGFSRVTFLQHLEKLGFKFIIRTQAKVWVETQSFRGTLGILEVPRGTKRDLGVIKYHKLAQWPVRLAVCFDPRQKEPWFLATNVKDEPLSKIIAWYGRRMEVEEFFKDLKNERDGFKLRGLKLSSPGRYSRLFLLMAYAYFLLSVIGLWAEREGLHRRLMANTEKRRTLAPFRVGFYIFSSWKRSLWQKLPTLNSLVFRQAAQLLDVAG